MLKKVVAGVALLSLVGCGPDVVCPRNTRVMIPDAEIQIPASANTKIAVLPVDLKFKDDAASKVKVKFRKVIESEVRRSGGKLLDRELADKLAKEIAIAEANNETSKNTSATSSSSLIIASEIESIDYTHDFIEGHYAKNILTGKKMYVNPSCTHRVEVNASVRVINRATGDVIDQFEVDGRESNSMDTRNSRCQIHLEEYASLATKATAKALENDAALRNALAPAAPILELRQCDIGSMVSIGMGKNLHIMPDTEVQFFNLEQDDDGEIIPVMYGSGNVVNVPGAGITKTKSWVYIDDEVATMVKKGDKVKIKFDDCDGLLDIGCHTSNASESVSELFGL